MPEYIVKLKDGKRDYYMLWDSEKKGPVSTGFKLKDFTEYYRHRYGGSRTIMSELTERLKRVDEVGISSRTVSLEELLDKNTAGVMEKKLSEQEIIEKFCRKDSL